MGAVGWAAVAAVGSLATLVVAIVAAWVALGQLRQSRSLAREQARPYVVVDFEPSPVSNHFRDFVLRNIGQTPAYDVRIRWNPDPIPSRDILGSEFAKIRAFRESISMLPPGREMRFFFDSMIERHNRNDLATAFSVTVSYSASGNGGGERFEEVTKLDIDSMKGATYIDVKGAHHLAQELERLRKAFERSPLSRGPVEVTTERRDQFTSRQRAMYNAVVGQDRSTRIPTPPKPKNRGH